MKRKQITFIAFLVGAALFATTAFADVAIGSGYYRLKEAAKTTMAQLSDTVDNFSYSFNAGMYIDGNTCMENSETAKIDITAQSTERISKNFNYAYSGDAARSEHYYYEDSEYYIRRAMDGEEFDYYVDKRIRPASYTVFANPFEEDEAADIEKIVDAFVGNLKDLVMVEDGDGNTVYTGNLNETQVPALANAITSFVVKYGMMSDYEIDRLEKAGLPAMKNNIFLQECGGKAIQNSDGILTSAVASATITGEDDSGTSHVMELNISLDIFDIGSTTVEKPNLEDAEVCYNTDTSNRMFDRKYVGVYKSNIIAEEDGNFVKIGERIFEITEISEEEIKGKFYTTVPEEGVPEYLEFTGTPEDRWYVSFIYTDENGETKGGQIHTQGSMNQNLNVNFGAKLNENGEIEYWESMVASGLYVRSFE